MRILEQHRCDECNRPCETWDTEWQYFNGGTDSCPECTEAMYCPVDDAEGDWTDA